MHRFKHSSLNLIYSKFLSFAKFKARKRYMNTVKCFMLLTCCCVQIMKEAQIAYTLLSIKVNYLQQNNIIVKTLQWIRLKARTRDIYICGETFYNFWYILTPHMVYRNRPTLQPFAIFSFNFLSNLIYLTKINSLHSSVDQCFPDAEKNVIFPHFGSNLTWHYKRSPAVPSIVPTYKFN
jgi:hypothetical protein